VLTNIVTGTTTLAFEALGADMSTSPVQFPAARPEVFTCTLKVFGVAPLFWLRTIQLPQVVVWVVAVKLTLAPVLLLSVRVSAAGTAVPS
jgi:hypothetical protein